MAARASVIVKHIVTSKEEKKVFAPKKRFDHTAPVQNGFGVGFAYETREASVMEGVKHDPNNPSLALERACYAKIGPRSNGQLLGRAPLKVGKQPTVANRPFACQFDANENFPDRYVRHLAWTNVISGGWSGALKQFVRFTEGTRTLPKAYTRRIRNIAKFDDRVKLDSALPTPKCADIAFMPFRPSSLPGGDMTGSFVNKGSAWKTSCVTAMRLWKSIHEQPTHNVSIYTCGGREKVSEGKDQGDWLQSRLVCQQDHVEFNVAKPYVRNIEQFLFNDWMSPIKIGRKLTGFRYNTLLAELTHYKYGMEFDWSGYDSTVNAEFIVAAFAVARSWFEESTEIDNAFCYFCNGYLQKYIVASDGNTFKVSRGTPSGNAWTTVINSIVNALLIEDICSHYGALSGNKEFSYMVAGDDGCILWNERPSLRVSALESWVERQYNMRLEVTGIGECISEDPNNSISFNKKCYYWDGDRAQVTTVPKLLAKRVVPVARISSTVNKMIDTITGQYNEVLTHPDCKLILGVAGAYMTGEARPFAVSDIYNLVGMTNDQLYFSPLPETLYNTDIYSTDKVHPLRDQWIWDSECDMDVVNNWLKDNTIAFSGMTIDKESRLRWFISKVGHPTPVAVLWRLLRRESINPINFGVPQSEIDFIYSVWQKWYDIDPYDYT